MRMLSVLIFASSSLLAQGGDYEGLVKEYETARVDADELVPRFQKAAEQNAGTEAAVPFLLWIFENGGPHREATTQALETLMEDHLESPRMGAVADRLPYMFPVLGTQKVLLHLDYLAEVENPEVQARARYARASFFTSNWGEGARDSERKMSEADLAAVVELSENEELRNRASAMRLPARGLNIGDLAPDVFGIDIDGVPFKLSDYRGKVVVLDFWGDW